VEILWEVLAGDQFGSGRRFPIFHVLTKTACFQGLLGAHSCSTKQNASGFRDIRENT